MPTPERQHGELPSLSSSLLMRVQQMQPDAWARLVEVFSPIVYRWSRQAGLSGADSADVVQDVFIAVARNVPKFERQKEKASFRSWLATITRNRVRDCFRRRLRHPEGFGGTEALQRFQEHPDPHAGTTSSAAASGKSLPQTIDALEEQLEHSISLDDLNGRLPKQILEVVKNDSDPKTWRAFWLTTVKGDAAKDVADRLEMNLASVYQAKSRILRRLRARMDELP